MVALQMKPSEITAPVRTNIELASQVLTTIRNGQWGRTTGLVGTIDRAFDHAHEVGSVPTTLWDSVAGSRDSLRKQRDLYQENVRRHIGQIDRLDTHHRRECLQTNGEAIVLDAYAGVDKDPSPGLAKALTELLCPDVTGAATR